MRGVTRIASLLLAVILAGALGSTADAAQLQWWSHWAVEDSKKATAR